MDSAQNKKKFYKVLIFIGTVIFGLFLIVISVARASLETVTKENDVEKLRKIPITFEITDDKNQIKSMSYKLPEPGMTSDNFLYGFKKIRDILWIKFSSGFVKKSKIYLLLADKKMAEASLLFTKNQFQLGLKASQDAFNQLKYADQQIKIPKENDQIKQIKNQILLAGITYKEILKKYEKDFDFNNAELQKLINDLTSWSKKIKNELEKN